MRRTFVCLTAVILATFAAPVTAQEVKPDPITNVKRYKVYFYKFLPGGADKVRELLWNVFLPAMREAKTPLPIILHPDDGEWDMISLNPLPGGYADLHFNSSPTDAKWQSIAARKLGGADKLAAAGAEMAKLIDRQTSFVAHEHE